MADEVVLNIYRGDNTSGEMKEYRIPQQPGMVVLDAVHTVQAMHAGDLACRWNCKAGKCGSCGGRGQRQAAADVHGPAWTTIRKASRSRSGR